MNKSEAIRQVCKRRTPAKVSDLQPGDWFSFYANAGDVYVLRKPSRKQYSKSGEQKLRAVSLRGGVNIKLDRDAKVYLLEPEI